MANTEINLAFIKARRIELNKSLLEVAEALGFRDASTYWNYENGNFRLRADMLPQLAQILDCKIEKFFEN